MKIYDIPLLSGKKTYISGYGLMFAGLSKFIGSVAVVVGVIGQLLTGDISLMDFSAEIVTAVESAYMLFLGLGFVGTRHAIQKVTGK